MELTGKFFYASRAIRAEQTNEANRRITLSVSSETPAPRRYGGVEILKHGPGNVDLSRLRGMGSVLSNHNPNRIIARIDRAFLDNRRLRAEITFDADELGSAAFSKVKSGSLRGVSVGYMVEKARRVLEGEEFEGVKGPAIVVERWTPYEITLTPVPADPTVGVGRSLGDLYFNHSNSGGENMDGQEREEIIKITVAETIRRLGVAREAWMAEAARRAIQTIKDGNVEGLGVRMTRDKGFELLARAAAVSPETAAQAARLLIDGQPESQVLQFITEGHCQARNQGGHGQGGGRRLADIPDDEFARAICDVSDGPDLTN